ncbi:MAG: hypothetical protein IT374_17410 [Polyangiaceae bacterium]|nr:hypothetical protein [Polyangiaceae bacterium]
MTLTRHALASLTLLLSAAACSQKPVTVPVRSLERSGALSLLCLDPASNDQPGYPLETCGQIAGKSGAATELYALVNQTTRGEVAVISLSSGSVVDVDPATPSFGFLPVGAQPVDIVTSPDGVASFVASAEPSRTAIYALPSTKVRGGAPTLLSWPACTLPARPGRLAIVSAKNTDEACAAPSFRLDRDAATPPPETGQNGVLHDQTGQIPDGRRKLLVTLPTEGDLLVIDAQAVLDRQPGSFDACPIERRVKLKVELPESEPFLPSGPACPPAPPGVTSPLCPKPTTPQVSWGAPAGPKPSAIAVDGARLYVADEGAPVIHRVDLSDPCSPVELPPLLPASVDDPGRPVTTSAVAISPLTTDGKRFVYAVDHKTGGVMVFDVSDGVTNRAPVLRPRPDLFPYTPADRLQLSSPVRDVTFMTIELPTDVGGNLSPGVRCDPGDGASAEAASYRTAPDYTSGAAPRKLRGTFAIAAETNGQLTVVDLDDYDAPCRGPGFPGQADTTPSWVSGCASASSCSYASGSGETTCRAVVRHEVRGARFFQSGENTGPGQPFPLIDPQLSLKGTSLSYEAAPAVQRLPVLLPPADAAAVVPVGKVVDVSPVHANRSFLTPDWTEPRANFSQAYSLTFEGALPGFDGKVVRGLLTTAPGDAERGFYDPNAYFCSNGVHDEQAAALEGARVLGKPRLDPEVELFGRAHADVLEVASDLLDEDDPYWDAQGDRCDFFRCRAVYGTSDSPTLFRSYRVREAYQDRVIVDAEIAGSAADKPDRRRDGAVLDPSREGAYLEPECCFPTQVAYRVRAGNTWALTGSASGFLHHVTTDPATGRCIDAGVVQATGEICDPSQAVRTSRAYEVAYTDKLGDACAVRAGFSPRPHDDPRAFHNPSMFFVVYAGCDPSRRDMRFSWDWGPGFTPMSIALGQGSVAVAPQSLVKHPVLGASVLVTDGALQGVLLVDLMRLAVVGQYL